MTDEYIYGIGAMILILYFSIGRSLSRMADTLHDIEFELKSIEFELKRIKEKYNE